MALASFELLPLQRDNISYVFRIGMLDCKQSEHCDLMYTVRESIWYNSPMTVPIQNEGGVAYLNIPLFKKKHTHRNKPWHIMGWVE